MKTNLFLHHRYFCKTSYLFVVVLLQFVLSLNPAFAEIKNKDNGEITIGFIGSLTGVAASYGTSVMEGAQLALERLNAESNRVKIKLVIEDDSSNPKQTVTAYQKLKSFHSIDALIGGTWWANSIAKIVERDQIPFLSCETLYNEEFVKADNYFSISGDLRDWVRVFAPIITKNNYSTASVVRFTSGFADTIEREMQSLFSISGRKFIASYVYSDLEMSEAALFVLKLKNKQSDVVYIDAQPSSLATFLRRLSENPIPGLIVFTNDIFASALNEKLFDPGSLKNTIYFSNRTPFDADFSERFKKKYSKDPYIHADLGYLGVYLAAEAVKHDNPITALRSGELNVLGEKIKFNSDNVYSGINLEIWKARNGIVEKAD